MLGDALSVCNKIVCDTWQVYGEDEWSFGFCEQGTGVFSCPASKNPMYSYRECIVLGRTNFSIFKVNQILRELSREWPGSSYDLLAKNCNHFCDEFCEKLGVPKLPGISHFHFSTIVFVQIWMDFSKTSLSRVIGHFITFFNRQLSMCVLPSVFRSES